MDLKKRPSNDRLLFLFSRIKKFEQIQGLLVRGTGALIFRDNWAFL